MIGAINRRHASLTDFFNNFILSEARANHALALMRCF
jgi:hypothetical protein